MEFLNQIIKDSKNEYVGFVSDGVAAGRYQRFVDTGSYMLNAIVSGSIFGGISFKQDHCFGRRERRWQDYFCLSVVRYFLDSNPDGMVVYFESESAISSDMFESRGIDTSRVLLYPVETIQESVRSQSNR